MRYISKNSLLTFFYDKSAYNPFCLINAPFLRSRISEEELVDARDFVYRAIVYHVTDKFLPRSRILLTGLFRGGHSLPVYQFQGIK